MLYINHAQKAHVNQDSNWMLHINRAWYPHVNQDSHTECYTLTVHGKHTLIKISTLNAAR